MDLLERGRSLDELGSTLRWTDLIAFLQFLPPESNYMTARHPDTARRMRWLTELNSPQSFLLGEIHDRIETIQILLSGGIHPNKGILGRARDALTGAQPQPAVPVKQRRDPQEIRKQLKAAENR